jgi:hypothetical protein
MQIRGSFLTVQLMREYPGGHWAGAKQIVEERLTKRLTPSANYVAVVSSERRTCFSHARFVIRPQLARGAVAVAMCLSRKTPPRSFITIIGCGFPDRSVTSAIQNLGGCSNFCGGTGSPSWMLIVFSGLGFGSSAFAWGHAIQASPAATKWWL